MKKKKFFLVQEKEIEHNESLKEKNNEGMHLKLFVFEIIEGFFEE